MPPAGALLRTLDPAERYFWLLEQLGPANAVAMAHLDRHLDVEALGKAIAVIQGRHPLMRARAEVIDDELAFVEVDGEIPLALRSGSEDWRSVVEAELDTRFAPAPSPVVRCTYLEADASGRSTFILTAHHTITDGRVLMGAVQQVLRELDSSESTAASNEDIPSPLHDAFPEHLKSPRAVVELMRAVKPEREGLGPGAVFGFHARDERSQRSRLDHFVLSRQQTMGLRERVRGTGFTIHGALAAASLESARSLLDASDDQPIWLVSPTDLRERCEPPLPADHFSVAIGILCTPYEVAPGGDPDLALRVTEQTHREVARGQSHLFYRLSRVGAFSPRDEGVAAFGDWLAAAPQNIVVSNLGVLDDAGDPSWVKGISCTLSTTPNQVAFVAATTYQGRLVLDITCDRAKLPGEIMDRFIAEVGQRIGVPLEESTDSERD